MFRFLLAWTFRQVWDIAESTILCVVTLDAGSDSLVKAIAPFWPSIPCYQGIF